MEIYTPGTKLSNRSTISMFICKQKQKIYTKLVYLPEMNFDCKATTTSRLKNSVRFIITFMTLSIHLQCHYTFNALFFSKSFSSYLCCCTYIMEKLFLALFFFCNYFFYKIEARINANVVNFFFFVAHITVHLLRF